MPAPRIAVAYSGGLDTSVMLPWLREKYGAETIAVTADLGSNAELSTVRRKALASGARKAFVVDAREEFIRDYAFPSLRAGALYEGAYPLATALGRPLIAKILAQIAVAEHCTAVAHGCTGKGNDQVRIEIAVRALAPGMELIAPLRSWEFKSRHDELAYAKKHGIPVVATKKSPYSIDQNLWGVSIEAGPLEDPGVAPPESAYRITRAPERAPAKPAHVEISFDAGTPIAIGGKRLAPVALVERLNDLAGKHGIGRIDLVENRLVGIKSREIYEAPAAIVLHAAHEELERLTLDRATHAARRAMAIEYSRLVYDGLWLSPLRLAQQAFVDETQRRVTGTVRLKLYRGATTVAGRWSPYSMYDAGLATYSADDTYDHSAAEGFIKIFGLPLVTAMRAGRR